MPNVNWVPGSEMMIKDDNGLWTYTTDALESDLFSRYYPNTFDYVGLFSAAILPNEDLKSKVYEDLDAFLCRDSFVPNFLLLGCSDQFRSSWLM